MARTLNQCVEDVAGKLVLQIATLQQQLEAALEKIAELEAKQKS